MENERARKSNWHKLDNAALIYPSAGNEKWNNVFRVSAILKEEVNADLLQQALNIVIERFPLFDVTLRRGLFWYYFQDMVALPKVELEKDYPCRRMELNQKKHLFRILYINNKVSFETFHSITDGTGAVCFLNSLLGCYFKLQGKKVCEKQLVINYQDKPDYSEMEDSFKRFANNDGTNKRDNKKAYQVHGTPESNGRLNSITLLIDCNNLHSVARTFNATITEFLVSVYAFSIIKYRKCGVNSKRPVIISVPINLRKYFETNTLRNFSSWIDIVFDSKNNNIDLKELIDTCHSQMKKVNLNYLQKNINKNISAEKNIFVRIMPLFLKNIALNLSYKIFGEKAYTTVLTNLGKIAAPKEFEELVDHYDCLLGKSIINAINIGVASFNNKLSITFTGGIKEHYIERYFCEIIEKFGINIKIYSNIK